VQRSTQHPARSTVSREHGSALRPPWQVGAAVFGICGSIGFGFFGAALAYAGKFTRPAVQYVIEVVVALVAAGGAVWCMFGIGELIQFSVLC
jgi:hypothetical protein